MFPGNFAGLVVLSGDYPGVGVHDTRACTRPHPHCRYDPMVRVPFSSQKEPITCRTIARAGIAQADREMVRYPGSGTAMQLSPPSLVPSRFAALILSLPSPAGHPRPPPTLATIARALPFYVIRPSPSISLDLRLAFLFKCHLVDD
jgi:hypothetical protein